MEDSSRVAMYDSQENWSRARREAMIQKVICTFKNCTVDLISFEDVRTRLHLNQKLCRGIQNIELARIRGSVGRYKDFTSAFLPRRGNLRQRWERVKSLVSTQGMPPIEVYQVGDAYFVVDGNHRVSVARQEGMKTIEAYVCEFMTPVGLSADADLNEVIIKSEYTEFLDKTHLHKLQPGKEIIFTSPGYYRELECMIMLFREALEATRGESVSNEEALLLWYDMVYSPAIYEIEKSGVIKRFPGRTEADLFIWMWRQQHKLLKRYTPTQVLNTLKPTSSAVRSLWSRIISCIQEKITRKI